MKTTTEPNLKTLFPYPDPTAREIWVPCEATDEKREQYWCPCGRWNTTPNICIEPDCGKIWRKRISVPEGWEIVPEGASIPKEFQRFSDHFIWEEGVLFCDGDDVVRRGSRNSYCYIRRKPDAVKCDNCSVNGQVNCPMHGPDGSDAVSATITERGKVYGDPLESHANIGLAWTGLIQQHYGITLAHPLPASLVAQCMIAFKNQRSAKVYKDDNYLDLAAYARFAEQFQKEGK